jgi:K+ transporter
MIGGATFLADGMMTPAVTVTAAIEGLKGIAINNNILIHNQTQVIIITLIILSTLFFIQRFGTQLIGRAFGPIMLVWFSFLGIMGIYNLSFDWSIIRALNPYYAFELLRSPINIRGVFILGSIFLATTGAEALYSDMGHVGRPNIYTSWPFVKICLLLSYLGQAVWLLRVKGDAGIISMGSAMNPFYQSMPQTFRLFGIFLSAMAAIIASQALISGSYTLVSEATKLRIFPRLKTYYPTNFKGQLYIPTVNSIIWVICLFIVFISRHLKICQMLTD